MAGASSETNGYISRGNMTVILTAAGLVMAAFGAFITLGNNATDRRITEVREDVRAIQQGYLKKDEHEEFKLRVDKDIARIERTEVPRSEVEANAARETAALQNLTTRVEELRRDLAGITTPQSQFARMESDIAELRKQLNEARLK